jgi:SAM-dependent methyltransferase
VRDFLPDALGSLRIRQSNLPMPPARHRRSVGLSSSRTEFDAVGELIARGVTTAFQEARDPAREYPRWLDFGSGAGRVARFMTRSDDVSHLTGVDVDRKAISWADRNLPGAYLPIDSLPPTTLEPKCFDVVYAISVFTHLPEDAGLAWLREIIRVLRPGGLLIVSTMSERLVAGRPDLSAEDRDRLRSTGFAFLKGPSGRFSDDSAFHTCGYLERVWGAEHGLALRQFRDHGLAGFQDLAVWTT